MHAAGVGTSSNKCAYPCSCPHQLLGGAPSRGAQGGFLCGHVACGRDWKHPHATENPTLHGSAAMQAKLKTTHKGTDKAEPYGMLERCPSALSTQASLPSVNRAQS